MTGAIANPAALAVTAPWLMAVAVLTLRCVATGAGVALAGPVRSLTLVAFRLLADVPSPSGASAPPGVGPKLETILSWGSWVALGFCVAGVIVAAARMAISHRRGESGEHAAGIAFALFASVVIVGAAGLIRFVAG